MGRIKNLTLLLLFAVLLAVGFQNCSGFSTADQAFRGQSSSLQTELTDVSNVVELSSSSMQGNSNSNGVANPLVEVAGRAAIDMKKRIWFSPNLDSNDYRSLMQFDWNQSREVQVFKFHSGNLNDSGFGGNNFTEFSAMDGFRRLKSYGLEIAIEAGAIKKYTDGNPDWCNGKVWTKAAQDYIQKVESQLNPGQIVDWLHIDEPLYQTKDGCLVTFDQAVSITSQYIKTIKSSRPYIKIIDIEPYPAMTVEEIKSWVNSLISSGAPLDGLTLDIDRSRVDIGSESEKKKLLDLAVFIASKKIRFGMIYWGIRTESNQVYVQDVLNFYVDTAYLRPYVQDTIFQNWHPSQNGQLDIPSNLINANNPVSSHLGLIKSALKYSTQFQTLNQNVCSVEVHPMEYIAFHSDLRNVDALEHYLNFGGAEKRCKLIANMPPGFFRIVDGPTAIYNSNGSGNYCAFKSPQAYTLAGGLPGETNVRKVKAVTAGMKYDGICVVPGAL